METFDGSNRFIRQARREERCGVSGKCRNAVGEPLWPTEGWCFAPTGQRYGPLVDGRSTAGPVPNQQTRNTGQTIPYDLEAV